MIEFTGYDAYVTYLAFKSHFAEGSTYDFFRFNGKTKASVKTFESRKDKYYFDKLAVKFGRDKTIAKMLVEQIKNPNFWVKDLFTRENEESYLRQKGYFEAFDYSFKKDLSFIKEFCLKNNLEIGDVFKVKDTHPIVFRFLVRKEIKIESFICIDMIIGLSEKMNNKVGSDPIWSEQFWLMKKYHPFIASNLPPRNKILKMMKDVLT